MTPEKAAVYYLASTNEACWRWSDNGQVLTWPSGATIAFRQEVEAVLRRLAPTGLPPFATVALALGFCRPEIPTLKDVQVRLEDVNDLATCAARFAAIPVAVRTVHKSQLIEGLFEPMPLRWLADDSARVLDGLQRITPHDLCELLPTPSKRVDVPQAAWLLRKALETFDLDEWEVRRRTGLSEAPRPAQVEPPDGQRIRNLLHELQDDRDLAGISALARQLLAAVSVPRPVTLHEELPIGGISDISNRGTLDRLVPSELVHDDLTLAVRVALNEALYWRRESPPRNPPQARCLLIDAGLRLWGLPRVFGMAVGLALSAMAAPGAELKTFVALADRATPADFTTREGLVRALEPLSPAIHPGAALADFVSVIDKAGGTAEAILITSEDTFDDPDFQSALAEVARPMLLATVNRAGDYQLYAVTRRERRPLNRARLDLDVLYTRPKALRTRPTDARLPVVFSLPEFPLRLPHARTESRKLVSPGEYFPGIGVLAVTNDCRLMLWDKPRAAARQLVDCVPTRSPLLMTVRERTVCVLFPATRTQPAKLLTRHLDTAETVLLSLPQIVHNVSGGWEHEGDFYLESFDRTLRVLDPLTGHVRCEIPSPGTRANGRFYRTPDNHWWAALFNGERSRLVRVPMLPKGGMPRSLPAHSLIGFVDSPEGPVGVACHAGTVYLLAEHVKQLHIGYTLQPPLKIQAVSRDNQRVWIGSESSRGVIVSLGETPSWQTARRDWWEQLEPALGTHIRDASLRSHLAGVIVFQEELGLVTRRGQRLVFKLDPSGKAVLLPTCASEPSALVVNFTPVTYPTGVKFTLQVATGPSGSKAWCDSRGLLHLCPVDPSENELCLVLPSEGSVAGWSCSGELHGSPYYLGDQQSCRASQLFDQVTRFARGWM